jgi:hypothetical protein
MVTINESETDIFNLIGTCPGCGSHDIAIRSEIRECDCNDLECTGDRSFVIVECENCGNGIAEAGDD